MSRPRVIGHGHGTSARGGTTTVTVRPEHRSQPVDGRGAGRIPRPPLTLVTRERLHSALEVGVRAPLTMLVAPAGTGKTVLLSDWVARRRGAGGAVAWVSGQAPGSLSHALEHALSSKGTAIADPIVVDDAHLLPAETATELAHVLRKSPHSVRVLLASRYDLPLPVPELELRGMALTLRSRDLRFTDAEATERAAGDGVRRWSR
jgi:LuxR family transcriptional regulator, maltose regulon positive regulatory protein